MIESVAARIDFFMIFSSKLLFKATPHNPRLTPLHVICLPFFRHISQILLERRQPSCVEFRQSDKKMDVASDAQGLCSVAFKNLFNTKNKVSDPKFYHVSAQLFELFLIDLEVLFNASDAVHHSFVIDISIAEIASVMLVESSFFACDSVFGSSDTL